MRIHRIEIEGFGPFRARQTIDLDTYAGDGIFLIAGRTGAGKSSILDAVCFALYGSAPRYEGVDKSLRSDHAEPDDITEIALEFTTAGKTWRIERSPDYERPKKRGGGTTMQKAEARMGARGADDWEWLAARPVDVANLVDEVIGLNQQQFLQVILLAQGRFARFLLAKNDERQALLRTLFGTKRFEEYEKSLDERRKAAEAAVAAQSHTLDVQLDHAATIAGSLVEPLEGTPVLVDRIEWTGRAALVARHTAEGADATQQQAAKALAAAETLHTQRTAQREKQEKLAALRVSMSALETRAAEIGELRAEREAAVRAEPVRGVRDTAGRALLALNTANDALEGAQVAWGSADTDVSGQDITELETFISAAQQRIGAWRPLEEIEARLASDEAVLAELQASRDEVAALTAALEERSAALPEERSRVETELQEVTLLAAAVDSRTQVLATVEAQLAAATAVAALADAQRDAFGAAHKAKSARDEVEAHLDDLRRRRFAGMAGELAGELIEGEPCTVCGSTSHPAPAVRAEDAVTADDVEQADGQRATATTAYEAANAALNTATRAYEDALKDSGGRSVDELTDARDDARAALDEAVAAGLAIEKLTAERTELEAEATTQNEKRTELTARHSSLIERIVAATAELERNRTAVAGARGASASVAERIDAEQRLVTLATALTGALAEADRADRTAVEAGEALEAVVAEAGFADADDAIAALRDASRRETLDQRIQTHDTDVAATKRQLLDLELEMLPDELVDTTASGAAVIETRAAWEVAVHERTVAAQRAQTLEASVATIEAAHTEIADLAAEAARIKRLADTISGRANNTKRMKLETFVLAAELEEIVQAANIRLGEMSGERYTLQHTDALAARGAASGLGLEVMDRFTGRARPAHSLSGGETFLASLALALGLAEVVTSRAGGIRLDTLFIDEGFGSLDAETLDTAMRTLDELRQGGRTVGIISHVEAMKEQIPAQLLVEQTPQGWSVVRQ